MTDHRMRSALADEHRSARRDPREHSRALERAHSLQGRFNAFATLADERRTCARRRACARDRARQGPGPLAGVPVSVKDILDVAGLPTRWGSTLMAQAPPAKADVAAVARLRAAGAVVIGKTTTTEFAHSPLGMSPLTGLTRNPWAPARTCGGSSAGAGVASRPVSRRFRSPPMPAAPRGCRRRAPACTGSSRRSARRRTIACRKRSPTSSISACWRQGGATSRLGST